MAVGFKTITLTPSAAVATDATMTFTYASGNASQWKQSGEVLVIKGLQNVLPQAADTFTLAYGASSVVVTYKDATSIPAGTEVTLQLPVAIYADLTALTDSSGGVAATTIPAQSGSYVQATQQTTIASLTAAINNLTARVNTLLALSRVSDQVPK